MYCFKSYSKEQFETIWEWLPEIYKLCDPHLIFSTNRDGHSLKHLVGSCSLYIKNPVLILIESAQ